MGNELNDFHKSLIRLAEKLNSDLLSALQHFLEYAISIHSFSIKKDMIHFSKEIQIAFYQVYKDWIFTQKKMLCEKNYEWFDAFGTYFEEYSGKWSRQRNGQFFTPSHLCDFMVHITVDKDSSNLKIPDPACGSGRLLIASHAYNPRNFHFGCDIDYLCCLMTSLNMMIHGARGQVVHKNALDPNQYLQGWDINHNIVAFKGIPHIEILEKENSIIYQNDLVNRTDRENQTKHNVKETFFDATPNYNELFKNANNKTDLDF